MKAKQFKSLTIGDSVTLSASSNDYYSKLMIPSGSVGIFNSFAPAVIGHERDFAIVDFPSLAKPYTTLSGQTELHTPRCGAFPNNLA